MRALILSLAVACVGFAQVDSNSVTVTATRQFYPVLNQVTWVIYLNASDNADLDDITAALRAAGVINAKFSGASQNYGVDLMQGPRWSFTVTSPIASLKDTAALLVAAQKKIQSQGMSMDFDIAGLQPSNQTVTAQPCSQSDLIADARAQAQKMTDAAGVVLGPILAVSDAGLPNATVVYGYAAFLLGVVSTQAATPSTCSLTVKFGMSRY